MEFTAKHIEVTNMQKFYIFNGGERVGYVYANSYSDAFFKCHKKYGESVATESTISKHKTIDSPFYCEMAGYKGVNPKWDFNNQKGSCTSQCDDCKLMVSNNE